MSCSITEQIFFPSNIPPAKHFWITYAKLGTQIQDNCVTYTADAQTRWIARRAMLTIGREKEIMRDWKGSRLLPATWVFSLYRVSSRRIWALLPALIFCILNEPPLTLALKNRLVVLYSQNQNNLFKSKTIEQWKNFLKKESLSSGNKRWM